MFHPLRIGALLGALAIPGAYAACRELPREGLPAHGVDEPRPAALLPVARGSSEPAPTAPSPTPAASVDQETQLASTVAELRRNCGAPVATLEGAPGDGVVFNNAMTSADAGSIDRMASVLAALRASHGALRCCFDGWARENPDAEARLMLRIHLDGHGAVREAQVEVDASAAVVDPVAQACATQIVREGLYPASPTDSETWVEYPLTARSGGR